MAHELGRLAARRPATAAAARSALSPATAGAAVAGLWGGVVGVINLRRYRRKEISGQEAIASTARESVGAGLASSLGLVAGNVARAALLATSLAGPVSFAVGTVVTAATKLLWDRAARARGQTRDGAR